MIAVCTLCGELMPPGEQMFKFHGYSGPCPKPPLAERPVLGGIGDHTAGIVSGVSRVPDREEELTLYCKRRPTDDELRALFEVVKVVGAE